MGTHRTTGQEGWDNRTRETEEEGNTANRTPLAYHMECADTSPTATGQSSYGNLGRTGTTLGTTTV